MHVVVIAVVRARADDDGFKRLGAVVAGGDHEGVYRAPRFAHHPDVAVAVGMGGDLLDHLYAVHELLVGVLVGEDPLGVARALQIDPEGQVLVVGEPGMHLAIRGHRPVPAPIREELDDGGRLPPALHGVGVVPVVADQLDWVLARVLHRKRYVFWIGNLVLGVEVTRFRSRLFLRTGLFLRIRPATE